MIPTVADLFDLDHCPAPALFEKPGEPWAGLREIAGAIDSLVAARGDFYTLHSPGVYIGPGTTVAPTACIQGPAIFGANCEIRHSAFIRNDVIAGDGCVVGNSTELKNSVLFDNVQVPHFNYVGDSILGHKAHLGAGVILSNVRLDGKTIAIPVVTPDGGRTRVESGLLKFGALIGDHVEIGCNSVLNPGTVVGRKVVVHPLSAVWGVVPPGSVIRRSR